MDPREEWGDKEAGAPLPAHGPGLLKVADVVP